MSKYRVYFVTKISVEVSIDAESEDEAADAAWDVADEYLHTVWGNGRDVTASASLDGVGADDVEAAS